MDLLKSVSPALPADVLITFAETPAEEVAAATAKARRAQAEWWAAGPVARANALAKAAEALEAAAQEMTDLAIREVGKPVAEMVGEVARGVSILRYYSQAALDPDGDSLPAGNPDGLLIARRRPHGVAGLITPWNFPVAIPLWKAAPALAYGNGVLLKPAPAATATALRLKEILDATLPEGLFQVVPGDKVTGEALISNVDAVSFTGSTKVGKAVALACAARGIPVQTEMGGQNPSVVFPDAAVASAAKMIAGAAMGFSGQKCTATSRIIVVGEVPGFLDALVAEVEALKVGDPAESATVVGPVISDTAAAAVADAGAEAAASGGRVLSGGSRRAGEGYYVEPTLVTGVDQSQRLARVEIFGPFALVMQAADEAEAVHIANDVPYGLVASVFTSDLDRALRLGARLETGLARVNAPTSGVDFYAPFGGMKESSFGPREQGKAARDFYTWTQTLTILPAR
ncbi:MAG: aldehyde dehydrogenase family protein [Actinomycetota bacterium]|nr:aldehyde dehydrogenase family protein [Actinomycetota bacterium]